MTEQEQADMAFWKRRMEWAEYHRQPIYVTPEEYREIRTLIDKAEEEDRRHRGYCPPPWAAGVIAPLGTRVVVDPGMAMVQKVQMMG